MDLPGVDNIPAELMKHSGPKLVSIYTIICQLTNMEEQTMATDLDPVTHPLYRLGKP